MHFQAHNIIFYIVIIVTFIVFVSSNDNAGHSQELINKGGQYMHLILERKMYYLSSCYALCLSFRCSLYIPIFFMFQSLLWMMNRNITKKKNQFVNIRMLL